MSDRFRRRAARVGTVTMASMAAVALGAVAFMSATVTASGTSEGGTFTLVVDSEQRDPDTGRLHFGDEPLDPVRVDSLDDVGQELLLGQADQAATATISVTSPDFSGDAAANLARVRTDDVAAPGDVATDQDAALWLMACNTGLRTLAQCTQPANLAVLAADTTDFDFWTTLRPGVDDVDLLVWLVQEQDDTTDHGPTTTEVALDFAGYTGRTTRTLPEPYPEPPYAPLAEARVLTSEVGLGDQFAVAFDLVDAAGATSGITTDGVLSLHGTETGDASVDLTGTAWVVESQDATHTPAAAWTLLDGTIDLVLAGTTVADDGTEVQHLVEVVDVPLVNGRFAVDLDALGEDVAGALRQLAADEAAVTLTARRGDAVSRHVLATSLALAAIDDLEPAAAGLLLDLADGVDAGTNACRTPAVEPLCLAADDAFAALVDAPSDPTTLLRVMFPSDEPTEDPSR